MTFNRLGLLLLLALSSLANLAHAELGVICRTPGGESRLVHQIPVELTERGNEQDVWNDFAESVDRQLPGGISSDLNCGIENFDPRIFHKLKGTLGDIPNKI